MTVLVALPDRALGVGSTAEEAQLVLAGHVGGTVGIAPAAQRAHPTPAVGLLGASKSRPTIDVGSTRAARRSRASTGLEATARIGVTVAEPGIERIIVVATACKERQKHRR
jgi:hypothetical protein